MLTGAACGEGNAYPYGVPDFTSVVIEAHVVLSYVSPYFMPFGF